jgi:lambda family phage tail tape measure protein
MAGLGDLVVRLSAETAQFTQALDKATYQTQKNFQTMQNSAKGLAGALGAYLSADAFAGFIKAQINAMDAFNDMAERTGVAVEELSKLSYAAKLSDVTIEQLQMGLTKLNKGISETANGTGVVSKSFSAMGISVKNADGTLKNSAQVLNDIADKFASYQDGANKSALAIQIFGKSGAELIPLLNQGSDGLKRMGDELQRLGGVVTADAAKNAGLFNDNMDKLGVTISALGKSFANTILPYMIRFSQELLTARANGLGLIDTLSLLGSLNGRVEERLKGVNEQIEKLSDPKRVVLGDRKKQIDELMKEKNAYEALLKYQEDSKKAQEDLNNASGKKKDAPAPVDDAVLKALSRSIELTDKYSASMTELIQKKELAMQAPFMTQAEIKLQEENIQIQKAFSDAQAGLIKLKEEGKLTDSAYTEQAQKLGQAYEQVITQTQRLYAEQEKLNSSWEYGANVALYKYAQESRNIAKITEGAVMGALNSLDDALFGIITRTTSVADAFKSMTISILSDIAKILIRQSITAPIAGVLAGAIGGAFTSNVNLGSQSLGSTSTGSTGFGINPNASLSGMRAMGGSVGAGNSYLVGEMGAEVFTPNTNGYITPNNQLGGSTNVVVNVNMAEGTTNASDGNQLGIMIGNVVKAELVKQKRAGGLLA